MDKEKELLNLLESASDKARSIEKFSDAEDAMLITAAIGDRVLHAVKGSTIGLIALLVQLIEDNPAFKDVIELTLKAYSHVKELDEEHKERVSTAS